jgi:hypothetical protein
MNKEIMKKLGFTKEVELVEQGRCPFCEKQVKIEDFKDEISTREFKISGLCQTCQDEVFEEEE